MKANRNVTRWKFWTKVCPNHLHRHLLPKAKRRNIFRLGACKLHCDHCFCPPAIFLMLKMTRETCFKYFIFCNFHETENKSTNNHEMDTLKFFSRRKFDLFGSNWYWLEQFEDYFTQVVFFLKF